MLTVSPAPDILIEKNTSTRTHRAPLAFAVFALALYVPGFWWGIPHATAPDRTHAWGTDDETPLGPLAEIHNIIQPKPDRNLGYPLMHSFVVSASYAPYLGYLWATGGLANISGAYPFGLADPSGLFVTRTKDPVSGTCITVTMEGRRPLLAEVQSLLAESPNSQPRRATSGLDSSRVAMLLAVLQQRAGCLLHKDDSYVATVGGVKLSEPATDLAVALAVASAKAKKPLPQRLIAFGEVGLAGEVRPVPGINQRIQEAHRLGFTHAVVPSSHNGPGPIPPGFSVREVGHLAEALSLLIS